jgi:hypothetical protein
MAAEDDAAGAADAQPAKQDWGADEDDNALPPLSNMGWADDDEDELPPLDPAWANLPIPDSPKREKQPAAFKPRDDRGAEPRGSVFSRLGDGGGNAWRRPDAPPDRGGPPDRGPPPSRDPPTSREAPARGRRREPENPHDWHREQMRLQEAERAARGERPTPPVHASNSRNHPQSANAMPAEVVYLSRDAQRAAALKREEDAAWRLARVPLATFHATAEGKPAPFAPSSCREMLNALSEPPFAEGRLAPNARAAFVAVASASKCGEKRTDEQVREVVQGVVAPLHHLLTHGVATPGGAAAGSTGAFIAEQMHTAAVKLLAAALEVLGTGEVTKDAVDNAKGIALVREAVKAKLEGKAGAAGGSGGGGGRPGVDKGAGRGDKNDKTPASGRGGHGKDGPAPTPPKGPDRDRWEKRPAPAPRDDDGSGSGSVGSRRRSVEYSDRRRSLEEKPSPRVSERRADEREPAPRPRVVPKVVIRPSKEDHRQNSAKSSPAPGKSAPQTAKAKNSRSDKKPSGETGDAPSSVSPVPGSGASVFSRLEGTPSPLPAPAEKHHSGSKPPTKSSPAAKPQPTPPPPLKTAVPPPKTASHELPHPKPAVPAPAAKPGKGGGGGGKGAGASSKGDASKKPGASASSGDEWHALDEELEKAAGKVSKGKGKERARESGKERAGGKAGSAEKHEIPHPKTAPPAAHSIPAPKPSPGTAPAPKPAPPKDELDAVLDEELAKAKKSRRSGGRGRGGK